MEFDGEPVEFEWNTFAGHTTLDLLHEIQRMMAENRIKLQTGDLGTGAQTFRPKEANEKKAKKKSDTSILDRCQNQESHRNSQTDGGWTEQALGRLPSGRPLASRSSRHIG